MHTHLEQWAVNAAAPREQLGVRCLAQGSHHSRGKFLPEPKFEHTNLGLQVRHSTSHDCPLTLSKHMTLSKDPFESRILYQCTIHETSCNRINTLYTCRYRCICKKTLTAQGIMQLFNIFTVQYVLLTASGWNG